MKPIEYELEEEIEVEEDLYLLIQLQNGLINREEYEEKLEELQKENERQLARQGLLAE